MSHNTNVQVGEGYYKKEKYNTFERFISYYFQIQKVVQSKGQSILEIGAGGNLVSSYLKGTGLSVTTCDFDEQVNPDIVADIRHIPVADKSFDVVLACQVLEHIPFEDLSKALHELRRIARKQVIVSVPYRSTFLEAVIKFPLIRTLFKQNFFNPIIRIPLKFAGFESSGQHHWEIDVSTYRKSRVKNILKEHFKICDEFSPPLNKFHYFFVLEPLAHVSEDLDPQFVKDTYNSFLSRLPEEYSFYRWQQTPVSRFHHTQTRRALRKTLSFVSGKHKVLEVGGGDGEWTPYFLQYASALDFVDISEEMIARAKKKLGGDMPINFIHGDILDVSLQHDVYGLIGAVRNLEYMPEKERVLQQYFSLLEGGGHVCIITKNPETDFRGYFKGKKLHGGQIKIGTLKDEMEKIGFRNIRIYPAIIGKKIKYAPVRVVWHTIHVVLLALPQFLIPMYIARLFSESFVIIAQK